MSGSRASEIRAKRHFVSRQQYLARQEAMRAAAVAQTTGVAGGTSLEPQLVMNEDGTYYLRVGAAAPTAAVAGQQLGGEYAYEPEDLARRREEELEESEKARRANMVPLNDKNPDFGLHPLVLGGIKAAAFHKLDSGKLRTWNEIVDSIYERVVHVEPFDVGPKEVKVASAAFCLLHRLFEIGLTRNQLQAILEHKDSPYIRAVGVLYVRIGLRPDLVWSWLEQMLDDPEPFTPWRLAGVRKPAHSSPIRLGDWVQTVLLDGKYFDIMLPRLPALIEREIRTELEARKGGTKKRSTVSSSAVSQGGASTTKPSPPPETNTASGVSDEEESARNAGEVISPTEKLAPGTVVRARFSEDNLWYDARVEELAAPDDVEKEEERGAAYWVTYLPEEEYGNQEVRHVSQMRRKRPAVAPPSSSHAPLLENTYAQPILKRTRYDDL